MAVIVQKFGGSSVADAHHVFNVAKNIINIYHQNNDVVVVVSAQGNTTDDLQNAVYEINQNASKRETDAFLAAGEQMSSALLAVAIQKLGCPAVSLTGWQAGFLTDNEHSCAKIKKIDVKRIQKELALKNIVVVAGFQGINERGDITTLGRGGSDTSAVALAAALKADVCKIYTDVDGVYTADPRIVPTAKKWRTLSYDKMFELSFRGAQVLSSSSIEVAKNTGVKIEVLSSLSANTSGTIIENKNAPVCNSTSGISLENSLAKVTLTGREFSDEFKNNIFNKAEELGLLIDKGLKPNGKHQLNSCDFVVKESEIDQILDIVSSMNQDSNAQIFYDKNKSKISVINISDSININVASIIFEVLAELNIEIEMVACDEKRVSIIVESLNARTAVNAIHSKLFEEDSLI